jgi:hypothetical protein
LVFFVFWYENLPSGNPGHTENVEKRWFRFKTNRSAKRDGRCRQAFTFKEQLFFAVRERAKKIRPLEKKLEKKTSTSTDMPVPQKNRDLWNFNLG